MVFKWKEIGKDFEIELKRDEILNGDRNGIEKEWE